MSLFVRLSGFNTLMQSTSAIDMSSTGILNQTGVFAPLSLGFPATAIDEPFATPVANAAPNQPLRLDFELMVYSDMAGLGATESDFLLALPFGVPVFTLPPGYTVNIPELNIFNNFVALPATIFGDLFIVGTNASGINLGTVMNVTGSVDVSSNTSATGIDLSALTSVGGAVDVSGNTSATGIGLDALQSVGGEINVNGNTSAAGVDLGALTTVGGAVDVSGNTSATGIGLEALQSVGGAINVNGNTSAAGVDLGALTTVDGAVDVSGNAD